MSTAWLRTKSIWIPVVAVALAFLESLFLQISPGPGTVDASIYVGAALEIDARPTYQAGRIAYVLPIKWLSGMLPLELALPILNFILLSIFFWSVLSTLQKTRLNQRFFLLTICISVLISLPLVRTLRFGIPQAEAVILVLLALALFLLADRASPRSAYLMALSIGGILAIALNCNPGVLLMLPGLFLFCLIGCKSHGKVQLALVLTALVLGSIVIGLVGANSSGSAEFSAQVSDAVSSSLTQGLGERYVPPVDAIARTLLPYVSQLLLTILMTTIWCSQYQVRRRTDGALASFNVALVNVWVAPLVILLYDELFRGSMLFHEFYWIMTLPGLLVGIFWILGNGIAPSTISDTQQIPATWIRALVSIGVLVALVPMLFGDGLRTLKFASPIASSSNLKTISYFTDHVLPPSGCRDLNFFYLGSNPTLNVDGDAHWYLGELAYFDEFDSIAALCGYQVGVFRMEALEQASANRDSLPAGSYILLGRNREEIFKLGRLAGFNLNFANATKLIQCHTGLSWCWATVHRD